MSTRHRETFCSLIAGDEGGTRSASNIAERTVGGINGPASPLGADSTSLSALEGDNATSFPQHDETAHTRPSAKEERETTVLVLKQDEALPIPSVEVNSATPLLQKDKAVERVHSSSEDIKTVLLRQDENAVDSHPQEQDNRATSSQAVLTAQPLGSIEDDSACEYKVCCVRRYSG